MTLEEIVSDLLRAPRPKVTTREDIEKKYGVESRDAVEIIKRLQGKGAGKYVVGRGSFPTRLEWGNAKSAEENKPVMASQWQEPSYIDYPYPFDNNRYGTLRIPKDLTRDEAADFALFTNNILNSFVQKKIDG